MTDMSDDLTQRVADLEKVAARLIEQMDRMDKMLTHILAILKAMRVYGSEGV
jgi:hypothetical protein